MSDQRTSLTVFGVATSYHPDMPEDCRFSVVVELADGSCSTCGFGPDETSTVIKGIAAFLRALARRGAEPVELVR